MKVIYDINIEFVHPPIPERAWDYRATRSNYDEGDPCGYGRTPMIALAALLEQEMEREERSSELVDTIKEICLAGLPNAKA